MTDAQYVIRRIDREIWKRAKARAALEGRTLRFVLIEFLRAYAKHGFRVVEAFNGKDRQ